MREIPFIKGNFYHVYNRGTNKMPIFNTAADYDRFTNSLYLVNSERTAKMSDIEVENIWDIQRGKTLVDLVAWCLMPNHFHLLLKVKSKKSTSLFLQRLQNSHSKYFNTKNERSGNLFQGKSKSELASTNNYLKYLFSYIHLNPIKLIQKDWREAGIGNLTSVLEFLREYKYSSLLDYTGIKRPENKILNRSAAPGYFYRTEEHMQELVEWLSREKTEKRI